MFMASRPIAKYFVAVQHDEQFCAHDGASPSSVISSTSIRMVERGMNSMGLARERNGRSPFGSPSPAMLCMGRFCNSRPLPLSTMLYLKSIVLLLAGGRRPCPWREPG